MTSATSLDFATAARTLTRAARRRGLVGPSYRCPPRLVGVDRSIRRRRDGAVVSVRLRGRPWPAVLADMVEGVVVANGLGPPRADRLRAELWDALGKGVTNDHSHEANQANEANETNQAACSSDNERAGDVPYRATGARVA